MKTPKIFVIALFIMHLSLSSCDNNEEKDCTVCSNELNGFWVNLINQKDTISFDGQISRKDTLSNKFEHFYSYKPISDSIRIQYEGTFLIYIPEKSFKISLDKVGMILTIENFNKYFPYYPGTEFRKIPKL
jgi:hypothetical protein